MSALTLPVAEVFQSLQGEGPRAGRHVQFIRLGGCNLSCSWCDTPETWDHARYRLSEEAPPTTLEDLMGRVEPWVETVITGGEPLIHQNAEAWQQLLRRLHAASCPVALETNGTITPNATTRTYVAHYSVSPKLSHAGQHKRGQDPAMAVWPDDLKYRPSTAFKVVCRDARDVAAAVDLATAHGWPHWNVWVMPEGTDQATVLASWEEIAQAAVHHHVNATQRLHVLAWGNRRGT